MRQPHEHPTPANPYLFVGSDLAPSPAFSATQGGETAALARLAESLADKKWVCAFEKPKTDPTSLARPATTVLSPYLKFGCLLSRRFYKELMNVYKSSKSHTSPPVSLEGQLLWREFFYLVGHGTPNFDKMEGNAMCK